MKAQLRWAICVAALACVAILTLAQSEVGLGGVSFDFIARYAGGQVVAAGHSPYNNKVVFAKERSDHTSLVEPVYDPPPVVAAFRALTVIPLRAACFVVGLLSVVSCILLGWRFSRGSPTWLWPMAAVSLMVFSPARHTLHLGQTDLIALTLVLLFARSQPALALAKPQTTGLTALALFAGHVRERPVRAVLVATCGTLMLLAVSAVLGGAATWADWFDHLGERYGGARDHWLFLPAAAGLVVLVWGLNRKDAGRPVDIVCVAGAATGLLAVTGGWNPQWYLAQALPFAALLFAARAGDIALRRHHSALLVVACGFAAGDSYVVNSFNYRLWVPVAILACLMVGFVVMQEVRPAVAVAVVVLNAAITAVPLSKADRSVVPMTVGVILLYLVLELRPRLPAARRVVSQTAAVAQ